jgi:hypothetical protein
MEPNAMNTRRNQKFLEEEPAPREGRLATAIESRTSRLPSDLFLWTALGVMATAFVLSANRKKASALLLEPLAPMVLLLGIYNKLVKLQGHDSVGWPSR